MKPTQKYLHRMRAEWIRDTEPLSDTDLDAMLGTAGKPSDPAKRNPEPLTATGLADLLGVVIGRSNRRLAAAAEVFGLDNERLHRTAEAAEQSGTVDRVMANLSALERELGRRGPVARPLTKWILANAESLKAMMEADGLDHDQMADALARYFEGDNAQGKSNPEYAEAVRLYFDQRRESLDTDAKLIACCYLFGLDHESVVERAAILEFDAGAPPTTAAMRSVSFAIQERQPRISEYTAGMFFDIATEAMEHEIELGWNRSQTSAWIAARIQCAPDSIAMPAPQRRAG